MPTEELFCCDAKWSGHVNVGIYNSIVCRDFVCAIIVHAGPVQDEDLNFHSFFSNFKSELLVDSRTIISPKINILFAPLNGSRALNMNIEIGCNIRANASIEIEC